MSDSSPRWPGPNGSPGLDFSPYRKPSSKDAADKVPAAEGAAAKPVEASATKAAGASAGVTTRITPTLSERAANTAKEWAATPISGEVGSTVTSPAVAPAHPTTPPRAGSPKVEPVEGGTGAQEAARKARRTRKARLRLSRIDPWSVMKTTFLFAIAFGIMLVVVAFVLWSVLAGSGALESINMLINTLVGDSDTSFRIEDYLSVSRVMGFATVVAAIDVVIITAVATLFAFLYNLAATVMGGLEVTLAED